MGAVEEFRINHDDAVWARLQPATRLFAATRGLHYIVAMEHSFGGLAVARIWAPVGLSRWQKNAGSLLIDKQWWLPFPFVIGPLVGDSRAGEEKLVVRIIGTSMGKLSNLDMYRKIKVWTVSAADPSNETLRMLAFEGKAILQFLADRKEVQ